MEQPTAGTERIYRADFIKKRRVRKGRVEYLVKWKGYQNKDCTWEPAKNILDRTLIREYDQRRGRSKVGRRRRSELENFKPIGAPFYSSTSDDKNNNKSTPYHHKRQFLLDKSNGNGSVGFESGDINGSCDNEKLDSDPEYRFFNQLSLRKNNSGDKIPDSTELNNNTTRDQACFDWLASLHDGHDIPQRADVSEIDNAEIGQCSTVGHDVIESDQSTVEWVESDLEMDIEDDDKKGTKTKDGFPDVFALDVTCNSVTVTFLESPSKYGFFVTDE